MANSKYTLVAAALIASTGIVLAAPAPAPTPTPAPSFPPVNRALSKRNSSGCVFSGSDGYSKVSASKASCASITLSALTVPSGVTLDLTDLEDGTSVEFQGTTTFGYKEWEGPLVAVSGKKITVTGASGSSLDGLGAKYWDGEGDGGKTKPKFFQAHSLTDSTITGIKIVNPPVQVFSINGVDTLTLSDIYIDASAGDAKGGKNTDGFDIGSSTGVTITGAKVYNQDDCVAINSGTNIKFSGGTCSGGHGLSIGSVGGRDDDTVSNVTFSDSTILNSQNGIRIKAKAGKTGSIKGITYSNIKMTGCTDYGIIVTQAYDGDSATTGIPISDFTLKSITGTMASGADDAIYIDCGKNACTDFTWTDVNVSGDVKCSNEPSGASTLCSASS